MYLNPLIEEELDQFVDKLKVGEEPEGVPVCLKCGKALLWDEEMYCCECLEEAEEEEEFYFTI